MKKIFVLISALFFFLAVNAQDKVLTIGGTTGVTNATNISTTTSALATIGRKIAAYSYVYQIDINAPVLYTYSVRLQQKYAENNTATAILYGALENNASAYKVITSVSFKGKVADTVIVGSITSAPTTYKYYKWVITPSDTIWVEHILHNFSPTVK